MSPVFLIISFNSFRNLFPFPSISGRRSHLAEKAPVLLEPSSPLADLAKTECCFKRVIAAGRPGGPHVMFQFKGFKSYCTNTFKRPCFVNILQDCRKHRMALRFSSCSKANMNTHQSFLGVFDQAGHQDLTAVGCRDATLGILDELFVPTSTSPYAEDP